MVFPWVGFSKFISCSLLLFTSMFLFSNGFRFICKVGKNCSFCNFRFLNNNEPLYGPFSRMYYSPLRGHSIIVCSLNSKTQDLTLVRTLAVTISPRYITLLVGPCPLSILPRNTHSPLGGECLVGFRKLGCNYNILLLKEFRFKMYSYCLT